MYCERSKFLASKSIQTAEHSVCSLATILTCQLGSSHIGIKTLYVGTGYKNINFNLGYKKYHRWLTIPSHALFTKINSWLEDYSQLHSLTELTYRHSWGILMIKIVWKLHFVCKNWKTLSEQKLIIIIDEINNVSRNISRISKACLETWCQYSRF